MCIRDRSYSTGAEIHLNALGLLSNMDPTVKDKEGTTTKSAVATGRCVSETVYDRSVYEARIDTTDPAHIAAGGSLSLEAGRAVNDRSVMTAGKTFTPVSYTHLKRRRFRGAAYDRKNILGRRAGGHRLRQRK